MTQNGLMTTMERKNRTMKGASEETQNKLFKEVLVSEEKLADADGELFKANVELRRLWRK